MCVRPRVGATPHRRAHGAPGSATVNDLADRVAHARELSAEVGRLLQRRVQLAQERFGERVRSAYERRGESLRPRPLTPWDAWGSWCRYSVDLAQRSILFWDTLRERGNVFTEHERAGKPAVLHFDSEMLVDGRRFERPVNYALLRIVPPPGVVVDPGRRPYLIIDPRAGHGPGIGGFKDDSQVGVALRDGHPVYFVTFFPDPEPGQTLLDVCAAEAKFVHRVRELHPDSPRPVIIGNCQGGWAAMMLAASQPEDTGPVVINGAPMSYWGGAWSEGEGDNPMRYSGGLLGGTWLASLVSDLGNGTFDGAWLVQNFENLNPANTFWDKYYHLFANVDSERPRFLEFERWWGGFYLLNRTEIEWIVENLFVGNKLWAGADRGRVGGTFDLREIRSPVILFASLGDNITPPQQAFNWVADVYGSTAEIKARGQVIVGLLHQDIGHLGIFVSGRVAKKEHAQIVSVLKSIEMLPPGLYGMQIRETPGPEGAGAYEVQFVEHDLEEVAARLNRFQRADEQPFRAVSAVSAFNQQAYELFGRPLVQTLSNELFADLQRRFHPLRAQRWGFSDLNPWLGWLGPLAGAVAATRQPLEPGDPWRQLEGWGADLFSASLDLYRGVRDAASEAAFFLIYGNLFALELAGRGTAGVEAAPAVPDPRDSPTVQAALAAAEEGGYPAAVTRVAALLARRGEPLPLSQFELKQEIVEDVKALLPDLALDQWKRLRGRQELIVQYAPEEALETLPRLLSRKSDRQRLLRLLERVLADPRVQEQWQPTPARSATLKRIRELLGGPGARPRRRTAASGRRRGEPS